MSKLDKVKKRMKVILSERIDDENFNNKEVAKFFNKLLRFEKYGLIELSLNEKGMITNSPTRLGEDFMEHVDIMREGDNDISVATFFMSDDEYREHTLMRKDDIIKKLNLSEDEFNELLNMTRLERIETLLKFKDMGLIDI